MEVWLPVAGWNGKFQAVGNGGWGGLINYPGTRVFSTRWARAPRRRSGCACSWPREWHIAVVAKDQTGLTPLPHLSSGLNRARLLDRLSPPTSPMER
jgi:hypothetical protein